MPQIAIHSGEPARLAAEAASGAPVAKGFKGALIEMQDNGCIAQIVLSGGSLDFVIEQLTRARDGLPLEVNPEVLIQMRLGQLQTEAPPSPPAETVQ
jgi:hypothetical protein